MTDKSTVDAYNDFADKYAEHTLDPEDSPFHSYYEKPAMRSLLPDVNEMKVLSLGCGSGEDTEYLRSQGAKAKGIDISEKLIEIAKGRYPDCDFKVMDMEKLDFEDSEFDFAYSSLAIHYINDWTNALKEAFRVLKPGAKYIFSAGHPIDTSMSRSTDGDISEVKLARIKNTKDSSFEVQGDYLVASSSGRKAIHGALFEDMRITVYHKTIGNMIEDIVGSGFQIIKLVEPLPTAKMNESSSRQFEYLNKIPMFLIWVLEKPSA